MLFIFYFIVLVYARRDDYFQVIDNSSFNMRSSADKIKFYDNFERIGDLFVYNDTIVLTPRINNTFGMFYTKQVILN